MDRRAANADDVRMTGQDGHPASRRGTAAALGVSVLIAGTLLTAVAVAARQADTASADTVLRTAAGAVLVLPDGTRRPAVEGEQVPDGATVELPGPGQAVLRTREREVYLAQASSVRVVDGSHQELRSGTAFVDAAGAPGLDLRTDSAVVDVRGGALVRVESGAVPRVAVLRTDRRDAVGADVRAAGRRAARPVPALYQVQVPRGGLPGRRAPLRLTPDDRYEEELVSDLVAADRYLNATGDVLQSSPAQVAVVRTALAQTSPGVPADREGGIAFLVAAATDEGTSRLAEVRELRAQGGSWGVVAAIVGSGVDEVGARLDALIAPTVEALPVAPGSVDITQALGLGGDVPDGTGDPAVVAPRPSDAPPRPRPTSAPSPGRTPSPTPSPDVTQTVGSTVDTVVDTVLGLITPSSPSSTPAATASPRPLVPVDLSPLLPGRYS